MQLGKRHLGPAGYHDFGQCLCILCVCYMEGGEKRKEEKENYFFGWIKGENTKSNTVLIHVFYKYKENLAYLQ